MIDSAQSHVCNFGEGVGIGHWIAVFFSLARALSQICRRGGSDCGERVGHSSGVCCLNNRTFFFLDTNAFPLRVTGTFSRRET